MELKLTTDDVRPHAPTGTPQHELERFAKVCNQLGLHPEARQILMQSQRKKERDQWVTTYHIMPTVDGLRVWAEQTGEIDGYEGPYYYGPDGRPVEVWTQQEYPVAVKVVLYRKGARNGFPNVAHWAEFAPYYEEKDGDGKRGARKLGAMWAKMPTHMLAKCAEAGALRKAFPKDLSNLYTQEEMEQAFAGSRNEVPRPATVVVDVKPSQPDEPVSPETTHKAVTTFWNWYNGKARPTAHVIDQAQKVLEILEGDPLLEFAQSLNDAGYTVGPDLKTVKSDA